MPLAKVQGMHFLSKARALLVLMVLLIPTLVSTRAAMSAEPPEKLDDLTLGISWAPKEFDIDLLRGSVCLFFFWEPTDVCLEGLKKMLGFAVANVEQPFYFVAGKFSHEYEKEIMQIIRCAGYSAATPNVWLGYGCKVEKRPPERPHVFLFDANGDIVIDRLYRSPSELGVLFKAATTEIEKTPEIHLGKQASERFADLRSKASTLSTLPEALAAIEKKSSEFPVDSEEGKELRGILDMILAFRIRTMRRGRAFIAYRPSLSVPMFEKVEKALNKSSLIGEFSAKFKDLKSSKDYKLSLALESKCKSLFSRIDGLKPCRECASSRESANFECKECLARNAAELKQIKYGLTACVDKSPDCPYAKYVRDVIEWLEEVD